MATAAEETAKAFITLLNPQAVRVVLPDLLAALGHQEELADQDRSPAGPV